MLELKRAVAPLLRRRPLLSDRPMRLMDPEIQAYFRDVADHVARVPEQVAAFDELLNSILQANLAQATVAQNEDMRKITSWAAIIAVPTMSLRGVRHELRPHAGDCTGSSGYPLVLSITVVICLGIHRTLKRNGWL
ncbi:magnesium and cobalt transport protein CorA [Streptomyces californicus]